MRVLANDTSAATTKAGKVTMAQTTAARCRRGYDGSAVAK
jgi:hypothetical protein